LSLGWPDEEWLAVFSADNLELGLELHANNDISVVVIAATVNAA
jgi:hypothetical protein